MKNADTAMYHAKERGRNNVQYFTAALNAAASERLGLENDLHQALRNDQLHLHYQPQVMPAMARSWASKPWRAGAIRCSATSRRSIHPHRRRVRPDRSPG